MHKHRIMTARAIVLLATALLLLARPQPLRADCGTAPSDTTFVPDNTTFPNYLVQVEPTSIIDGPLPSLVQTKTFTITRVVGPGTSTEFNSDGTLANWNTYVQNGVLSRYASIKIQPTGAIEGAVTPVTLQISLNGYPLEPLNNIDLLAQGVSGGPVCVQISTEHLKFAQRVPGQAPMPGVNTVGFIVDGDQQRTIDAGGLANPGFGTVTFKAMAPVVLVHGWNSGPWEWGPETPDPGGVCGAGELSSDKGRATINTLMDHKVPFDCSIKINRQALIDEGAQVLLSGGPATHSVKDIAAQFGARHVNIVTNSKGGLFTREFLDLNAGQDTSSQTGVISVTTLDTPHHGSILSDTAVLYNMGVRSVLSGSGRVFYRFGTLLPFTNTAQQLRNLFGRGNNDITVDGVEGFNARHRTPPDHYQIQFQDQSGNTSIHTILNPRYYSTSADADLNGNGQLEDSEAAPYIAPLARFNWNRIRTVQSFTVGTDSHGRTMVTSNAPSFPSENDIAVSIQSAQYLPSFTEINGVSYFANHASILCPQAGLQPSFCAPIRSPMLDVLDRIQQAQDGLNETIQ